MPDRRTTALVATLLFALATVVHADTVDAWHAGQDAFGRGDYESALLSFQTARDSGLGGSAVHYNIAVCHFKLGDFDSARESFRLIVDRFPKLRGLGEYNLGLVARRLRDTETARQHFLRAYQQSSDNETLRILSSRLLRETEPDTYSASNWSGAVGLRIGNDDNVALRDELGLPAGQTAESPFADIFVSIQGPWSGQSGFRFDGGAYLVRYFDADDFDQSEVRARGFYDWRLSDWRIELGAHANAGNLGGDAFDRKLGVSARAIRYLGSNTSVDLRYVYDDVSEADALFAGINGSRQQFDARYRWYSDAHRLVMRYWIETNDRDDPGVSPSRNRLGIEYRFQPDIGWGIEAGANLRKSNYDDLLIPRDEDLSTMHAGLTYTLKANWSATLDLRISENDSSDAAFSYTSRQVTLGVLKTF